MATMMTGTLTPASMEMKTYKYPNWCYECEVETYSPVGDYSNAEAEVKMIEHLDWYHFDEEKIQAILSSLVNDITVIAGMTANQNWWEAYVESGDIKERLELGLRGIAHFAEMQTN